MKLCKKCNIEKSLDDFHIDNRAKDKHHYLCKSCRSKKKLKKTLSPQRKNFDKNLASAMYRSIKSGKAGRWEKIFGFTLVELKKHLENQFTETMNWNNYGSYWWIDRIVPKSAYSYQNVKNNEFHKCWSLKNIRPLPRHEVVIKGNKILRELIERYKLFDILPIGIIPLDTSSENLTRIELEEMLKIFVEKFFKSKVLDKDLYIRMMDVATAWNKAEVLGIMLDKMRVQQDYGEEEVFFSIKSYLDLLLS